MALGLAIAHFKITYYSLVVGVVFVIVGLFFLVYSTLRYFRLMFLLNAGQFETNVFGVFLVVFVATVGAVTLTVIIAVGGGS